MLMKCQTCPRLPETPLLSGEKEDYPAIKALVIGEDNRDDDLDNLPGLLPRSQNPEIGEDTTPAPKKEHP
jgi:hypothetical protein